MQPGSVPTPRRGRYRTVEQLGANAHTEAAVGQILEFNALLAPELLNRADGGPPRFGVALLQLMDGTLGKTDA